MVFIDFLENFFLLECNIVVNKLIDVVLIVLLMWGNKFVFEEFDFDVVLVIDLMYYDDVV